MSSRSKLDLRETRLIVTVGAPSVEESCSQEVVMSSLLFRFRRGNSFSCTSGLNNLFFECQLHVLLVNKNTRFDRLEDGDYK